MICSFMFDVKKNKEMRKFIAYETARILQTQQTRN